MTVWLYVWLYTVCIYVCMYACMHVWVSVWLTMGTLKQRSALDLLFRKHHGYQNINYVVRIWNTLLNKGRSAQTTKHMTGCSGNIIGTHTKNQLHFRDLTNTFKPRQVPTRPPNVWLHVWRYDCLTVVHMYACICLYYPRCLNLSLI